MNRMKRILSLVLALALCALCFTACRKDKEPDPETTTVSNTVTVTFPEGITVLEIAEKLEKKGVCSAESFEEVCKSVPEGYEDLLSDTSADGRVFALEGYLFPDTYEFYKDEPAEDVVKRFLDNLASKLTDDMYDQATAKGFLNMDQLLSFASVIQAEASDPKEMPGVAGVFYNRLLDPAGYPYIGSDVTRQYIDTKMKDYIEEQGLPYDTLFGNYITNDAYTNKTSGLPIGPVCNPGLAAIKAALDPEESDYYYFFTDPDWNYYYFTNLSDFQTAWYNLQNTGSVKG